MDLFNILDNSQLCESYSGYKIFSFLGNILNIIFIAIPIIIVIFGTIDLVKAMVSSDQDNMKKKQFLFIKRLIIGVCIFFIPAIVTVIINMINGDVDTKSNTCLWSFFNPAEASKLAEQKKGNIIDLSDFSCPANTVLKEKSDYMCSEVDDCSKNALCVKDGDKYKCCEGNLE